MALTGYQRDLQHRLQVGARRRQPFVERAMQPTNRQPVGDGQPCAWKAAPAAWEIQAHRTLASQPDPADLVRVYRVQALIATTTVVVSAAAARRGESDAGVSERLTPALENAQLAWSRSARRCAELTTPASRTDQALVEPASERRAAIGATVGNQTGWATPDQMAGRIDLPATAMTLHRSLVAGVELAYVTREIAADHPGLGCSSPSDRHASQGEAEVAIEQRETRFEGVKWVTPHQIATNQNQPAAAWSTPPPMSLRRATRPWLQPLTLGPPNTACAWMPTVLGASAEPPRNAKFRSITRIHLTPEPHRDVARLHKVTPS
jgi:hypothetical protein